MLIGDVKYACATCIKGHRSSTCNHADRDLIEIKRKGRPVTQCTHCRELRKTKQVHVRCMCEGRNEAVAAAQARLVIHPNTSPSDSGLSTPSGCQCSERGDGACSCCVPRKALKKSSPSPNADIGISQASFDDQKPNLARGHTFSARSGETHHSSSLQRSTSLHGNHGQKTNHHHHHQHHHHAVHFAPYTNPHRGAEPDPPMDQKPTDLTDAIPSDPGLPAANSSSRSRSYSASASDQYREAAMLPQIYTNFAASVSSPHIGMPVPGSDLTYPSPFDGPASGQATFPGGFLVEYEAHLRRQAIPDSNAFPGELSAGGIMGNSRAASDGLPEIRLAPEDSLKAGLSMDVTGSLLNNLLSAPEGGLQRAEYHPSSGPPSMTSRSSSRSGRTSHDHFDFLSQPEYPIGAWGPESWRQPEVPGGNTPDPKLDYDSGPSSSTSGLSTLAWEDRPSNGILPNYDNYEEVKSVFPPWPQPMVQQDTSFANAPGTSSTSDEPEQTISPGQNLFNLSMTGRFSGIDSWQ